MKPESRTKFLWIFLLADGCLLAGSVAASLYFTNSVFWVLTGIFIASAISDAAAISKNYLAALEHNKKQ